MSVVEQVQKLEAHASSLIIGQAHDARDQGAGREHRGRFSSPAVHAGPAAGGPDRYRDLPSAGRHVRVPKKGPLFHNLILADEINRAPAKVQSALLEAMAERQITVGGE